MIGYMVQAWQGKADKPHIRIIDSRGPGTIAAAPLYFAGALLQVVLAAAGERPLLHIHVAGRGSTLRKVILVHLAAVLRLRMVLHLHDYDYGGFLDSLPRLAVAPIRSMFRRVQMVIVLGSADRTLLVRRFDLDPARVAVAPNAVPKPDRPERREARNGTAVRVLFLGNPSRRKGVHDLLAALRGLSDAELPAWRADIAGGGGEVDGFRAEAEALGLSDRVRFPGWLDQAAVRALLAQADILVLPSYAEGLAMSVLEGMSYGLCVICTPVGALAEVVEDDVSGRLVTPGDVAGLSAALKACIGDGALRRRLGDGAAVRFSQGYDVADYPAALERIYAQACA
jgi:glycosyltransferase involved in cell wall biosynthesis